MYISRDDVDRVKRAGDEHLQEIIESLVSLRRSGSSLIGQCPVCGHESGLIFTPGKNRYKCFHCNHETISGTSAVKFVQTCQNCTFPDAIKYIADLLHIYIEEEKPSGGAPKKKGSKAESKKHSYLDDFLSGSGLTMKDVEIHTTSEDGKTHIMGSAFKKGTLDSHGHIDKDGDDVIIEYYDLDGNPCMFERRTGRNQTERCEYFRVRWQYPEEHPDKDGKPAKYHSPYGSGSFIYIPQYIRDLYHHGETLQRLFIQEGEKKAEKACKHGIPSVAVSGITNIASGGKLSPDLVRILQEMQVKEVVMLYDSDCFDLSKNIKINDSVDKRPRNFFYAARNYKEWMRSLIGSRQLYVEIYIGHVLKNLQEDKGVDDLLCGTLKGKENLLKEDLDKLIFSKELKGEYLQLYKISSWSDNKLAEIWNLDNPQKFADAHREELQDLPEFKIGKHTWRFGAKGKLESAQAIEDEERFWKINDKTDRSGNAYQTYEFDYDCCIRFLQNRGFGRFRRQDGKTYSFIRYNKPFVEEQEPFDVRDYVMEFAKAFAGRGVINMLMKGGVQYMGPEKLSFMDYIKPPFEEAQRGRQYFYFKNYCWEVTADAIRQIDYAALDHCIWRDEQRNYEVRRTAPVMRVDKSADGDFEFAQLNKNCQFLQFLINTSNFTWRKEPQDISQEELQENTDHLVAKLCAIGYLCLSFKDKAVSRAVVAMDGKQSEVGQSNGRSGKSLVGDMLKYVHPTTYINGKNNDSTTDQFYFNDVDEKTKSVFIDDVRTNFSLEPLFAYITGDFSVNYKGGRRATFPFQKSPKIYLTTNHAINGTGSSFNDRQWKIAFSDFYNDTHKPTDDFGNLFFDEWDQEQWNLFWNMVAECVQLYLKFGVVQSPSERIEARQLRQQMGETFLAWADEYYSADEHINTKEARKILYDKYLEYSNEPRKYASPTAFKGRIKAYTKYKGLYFNPGRLDPTTHDPIYFDKDGRPDLDDKAGGVEYITLGNDSYWDKSRAATPSDKLSDDMEDFLNGN